MLLIAGVDEVGRGALFGPVVAAAVVFPTSAVSHLRRLGVKDSKQLSAKQRLLLKEQIEREALAYQVSFCTVAEIDQLNILQASLLAMKRSLDNLAVKPDFCLVDGNQSVPHLSIGQKTLVKGDARSPIIAAASILAKVARDRMIVNLAEQYPEYDLKANKGYGTKKHILALQKHGITPEHRLSFSPCQKVQLELPLTIRCQVSGVRYQV